MAKTTVKLESRFPQAKKGAADAVTHAIKEALVEGQEEAQGRIERARDKTGYDLDPFVVWQKHFKRADGELEGGMIFIHSDWWYYKFFEHGTVFIPATPFMRPAHRKMRDRFKAEMGDNFEKFVTRRTRMSSGQVTRR